MLSLSLSSHSLFLSLVSMATGGHLLRWCYGVELEPASGPEVDTGMVFRFRCLSAI